MVGSAVHIDRPPHSAFLIMWGRAPEAWWGCVQFRQAIVVVEGPGELTVAAWVPAASLSKPNWSASVEVPRVVLAADRALWPPPSGWPSWFAGPWSRGPLSLPPGVRTDDRPLWRRR